MRDVQPEILADMHECGNCAHSVTPNAFFANWARNLNVDEGIRTLTREMVEEYIWPTISAAGYSTAEYEFAEAGQEGILNGAVTLRHSLVFRSEAGALSAKIWPFGAEEPADWQVYRADPPGEHIFGRIAVLNNLENSKSQTAYFSMGPGGADAPRAPISLFDEPAAVDIVNITAPTIAGDAVEGEILIADPGEWEPADVALSYAWFADGVQISGETGTWLTLTSDEVGASVTVQVTARLDGSEPLTVASEAVGLWHL